MDDRAVGRSDNLGDWEQVVIWLAESTPNIDIGLMYLPKYGGGGGV